MIYFCAPGLHEIKDVPVLVIESRQPLRMTWMCEKHLYQELGDTRRGNVSRRSAIVTLLEPHIKTHLQKALEIHKGNRSKVASALGVSRTTVYRMMQRFDMAIYKSTLKGTYAISEVTLKPKVTLKPIAVKESDYDRMERERLESLEWESTSQQAR